MEQEKIFNLQLTVQKLEEELSLFRNGTTSEQLYDLLMEKDNEINNLNSILEAKDSTLNKLIKSSSEVLERCDKLQEKNDELAQERNNFDNIINSKDTIINDLQLQCNNKNQEIIILKEKLTTKELELSDASDELNNNKNINNSLINDLNQKDNTIKELNIIIQNKDNDINKLRTQLEDADSAIEKLQSRCAELINVKNTKFNELDSERKEMLNHVQKFRDTMNSNLSQRDQIIKKKDDRIKELTMQISIAKEEVNMIKKSYSDGNNNTSMLTHINETTELKSKLREQERRLASLEEQRRSWTKDKSELEILKQKLNFYETKNKIIIKDSKLLSDTNSEGSNEGSKNTSTAFNTITNNNKIKSALHFDATDFMRPISNSYNTKASTKPNKPTNNNALTTVSFDNI